MQTYRRILSYFWIATLPLSIVWAIVTFLRRRFYPQARRYQSTLKTICIGNVHSGGSGKTPLVVEIAEHFRVQDPVILSRGYKAALSNTGTWVLPDSSNGQKAYGDEPWWLSQKLGLPVFIAKRRVFGIREIEKQKRRALVILDDGFQHLALKRDVDIVAINVRYPVTESFCLPLGNLREPLSALRSASGIVLVFGENDPELAQWKEFLTDFAPGVPLFEARRQTLGLWEGDRPFQRKGAEKIIGFCGIAYPQAFEDELGQFAPSLVVKAFGDHHDYTEDDITVLIDEKKRLNGDLFATTEKDLPKVKAFFQGRKESLLTLRIRYEISKEFWYFLDTKLG